MSRDEEAIPAAERPGVVSKPRKWWRDSRYIAAMGAALAGVASFNPALNDWLTYSLESNKQEASRRDAFLDRAIDPQRNEAYRLSVLQYLVSTLPERDTMRIWAKEQLERLQAVLELERRKDRLAREITTRQKALSTANQRSPQRKKEQEEIEKLKGQVDELKVELDKALKAAAELRPPPAILNPRPSSPVTDSKANPPTKKSADKNPSLDQPSIFSTQGRVCCITCNGLEICGHFVQTVCGSCGGEGTDSLPN